MQSLALKIDDAVTHYRLRRQFRDCGMKLEAAEFPHRAGAAFPR